MMASEANELALALRSCLGDKLDRSSNVEAWAIVPYYSVHVGQVHALQQVRRSGCWAAACQLAHLHPPAQPSNARWQQFMYYMMHLYWPDHTWEAVKT